MINWLYKWLPIIFGCHCRPERSFFINGKQFPICARCTGELAGMLCALVSDFFYLPPIWIIVLLMAPMIADGLIQLKTSYESTNPRRFITGFLFGYGFMGLIFISSAAAMRAGYQFGHTIS